MTKKEEIIKLQTELEEMYDVMGSRISSLRGMVGKYVTGNVGETNIVKEIKKNG